LIKYKTKDGFTNKYGYAGIVPVRCDELNKLIETKKFGGRWIKVDEEFAIYDMDINKENGFYSSIIFKIVVLNMSESTWLIVKNRENKTLAVVKKWFSNDDDIQKMCHFSLFDKTEVFSDLRILLPIVMFRYQLKYPAM